MVKGWTKTEGETKSLNSSLHILTWSYVEMSDILCGFNWETNIWPAAKHLSSIWHVGADDEAILWDIIWVILHAHDGLVQIVTGDMEAMEHHIHASIWNVQTHWTQRQKQIFKHWKG